MIWAIISEGPGVFRFSFVPGTCADDAYVS